MDTNQQLPLTSLRSYASRLVAAAFCRLFPKALIVKGEVTDTGFYYDFVLDQTVTRDIFPLIEEHLRSLCVEDTPLRSHTMMRENAQELFRHFKQPIKADTLPEEQLVEVLQIGEFYDECPLPHPQTLKIFRALELLDIENISTAQGLKIVRIIGTAFHDKQELKTFLKKKKSYRSHETICESQNFFLKNNSISSGEWFELSRGIELIDQLKKFWSDLCVQDCVDFVRSPIVQDTASFESFGIHIQDLEPLAETLAPAHMAIMSEKRPKIGEFAKVFHSVDDDQLTGLFRTRVYWTDQVHILSDGSNLLKELISSLHFIAKSNKMLSIEGKWFLNSHGRAVKKSLRDWEQACEFLKEAFEKSQISTESLNEDGIDTLDAVAFRGPRLEYYFRDGLGRRWRGPHLGIWIPKKNGNWLLERSLFGSVERVIALLIEKGPLPTWLERKDKGIEFEN